MKEQRITIEISADGKMSADAEGFSGDACLKELEKLLEGLASIPVKVDRKAATTGAQVTQQQQSIGFNERKEKI
jgi:hypothetical protein